MAIDKLPKTRKGAIAAKSKFYFTGKKCLNGHLSKRHTISANCHECARIDIKAHKRNRKRHNRVNDETRKKATSSRLRWKIEDIETVTAKNTNGEYLLTGENAALLLNRSYRSIEHIRVKYSEQLDTKGVNA